MQLDFEKARLALKQQRDVLVMDQRGERERLERSHAKRWAREAPDPSVRLV